MRIRRRGCGTIGDGQCGTPPSDWRSRLGVARPARAGRCYGGCATSKGWTEVWARMAGAEIMQRYQCVVADRVSDMSRDIRSSDRRGGDEVIRSAGRDAGRRPDRRPPGTFRQNKRSLLLTPAMSRCVRASPLPIFWPWPNSWNFLDPLFPIFLTTYPYPLGVWPWLLIGSGGHSERTIRRTDRRRQ
jgi:hypothetical protein